MPHPAVRHSLFTGWFATMALLGGCTGAASAGGGTMNGTPPHGDRLGGVQIEVQRSAGQIAGSVAPRVLRSGDVAAEQADVRVMLDALHALNFFHLPEQMLVRTSIVRRDDGTEQIQVQRLVDEPATRVCVRRAGSAQAVAYEKCVRFTASAGPTGLVQWADKVLAPAVSR